MNGFKEFWVKQIANGTCEGMLYSTCFDKKVDRSIHVIEYSALEQAEAKNKKLEAEIEELKKELQNKDAVRLWNENEDLKRDAQKLVEALEFYAERDGEYDWPIDAREALTEWNKKRGEV